MHIGKRVTISKALKKEEEEKKRDDKPVLLLKQLQ